MSEHLGARSAPENEMSLLAVELESMLKKARCPEAIKILDFAIMNAKFQAGQIELRELFRRMETEIVK